MRKNTPTQLRSRPGLVTVRAGWQELQWPSAATRCHCRRTFWKRSTVCTVRAIKPNEFYTMPACLQLLWLLQQLERARQMKKHSSRCSFWSEQHRMSSLESRTCIVILMQVIFIKINFHLLYRFFYFSISWLMNFHIIFWKTLKWLPHIFVAYMNEGFNGASVS